MPPTVAALCRVVGCGALALLLQLPLAAQTAGRVGEFRDGDTVCFLGDSITKGGRYQLLLELYYARRFPERRIRFVDCGIGGDRASAILEQARFRLDDDVLGAAPTVVTVMLGMNDVERKLYEAGLSGPEVTEKRRAALVLYRTSLAGIVLRLQQHRARVILISPSVYDETAVTDRPALIGVDEALGECAAIVRTLAGELGCEYIDLHAAMAAAARREQARDRAFSITGAGQNWNDRVHPGPVGHFIIAQTILKAQGFHGDDTPPDAIRDSVPLLGRANTGLLELGARRRAIGDQLREIATQRYAMARENLAPRDDGAFVAWLAAKRSAIEAKGQQAKWIVQVQELLPRETALRQEYFALGEELRRHASAEKPAEHIGAEYGAYTPATDRTIAAPAGAAALLSLAGEWRCALDPQKKGVGEKWFSRVLAQPLQLPGTLDLAGLGEARDERTLRNLSRRCNYIGPAWYQRTVTIPAEWSGRRITLYLERVMWESRVYIDDEPVGARDSLCTPHEYDLTSRLTPGEHRLTIRVDNSSRPGANAHGYGDDLQIRWNGLLGRLELRAQDVVHIRSVQIHPETGGRRALVRVEVGTIANETFDGTVTVTARRRGGDWLPSVSANFRIAGETLPLQVALPLGDTPARWDEFTPNLYDARVNVAATAGVRKSADQTTVSFGLRELAARGTQLALNGRTVMLRGTHDGGGFPLTGHPAMDIAAWRRIFRTCREYGLNHVRYHSFCPPEAAFAAADEEGIILQAELPFWGRVAREWAGTAFLRAELGRILDTYGNHPSFCLMSMGNEHSGDWDVLGEMVAEAKRRDPRRLYAAASNQYIRQGKDPRPVNPDDDFAVIMKSGAAESGFERGRIRYMERLIHGEPPAFDADYRSILAGFHVPTLAHELGQWWVFPDPREAAKYSGVLRPGALELFRESLGRAGLLDQAARFQQASGALAVQLYKEDIERVLRTPGVGGFQLLDLHDYSGQNTSLVGVLDAFWETKGFVTPAEFRRFCAPTVVLARLPKRVWSGDEVLAAQFEVAHYGPADRAQVSPEWRVKTMAGQEIARGKLAPVTIAPGQTTSLGRAEVPLRAIASPAQLRLEMTAGAASNDWSLWVFPPEGQEPAAISGARNLQTTNRLDAATLDYIERGGRVLWLGHGSPNTVPTDFSTPVWNPWIGGSLTSCGLLIAASHPALAAFPTNTHSDWQWRDLLEPEARAFVLNDLPAGFQPIVTVIDEPLRAFRLGVLFEARVGEGVLLATSLDLAASFAGRQLRRSLIEYLGSAHCQPATSLTREQASRLYTGGRFQLVDGGPGNARVALEVVPAANAPEESASAWKPAHDRVLTRAAGFDYEFPPVPYDPWRNTPKVSWRKREHAAWSARHFTLQLRVPTGFSGVVLLQLRDDDSGQAAACVQSGRAACYVGSHRTPGQWVALRVAPADVEDGAINVTVFKPAGGEAWSRAPRITRLVVTSDPP